MPFPQIIPPLPSPTESKRLFYTSVSLLLSLIQGYHYHLSKLHIYALVYCFLICCLGLVIAFLPRSKHLLISWLQSPSAVICSYHLGIPRVLGPPYQELNEDQIYICYYRSKYHSCLIRKEEMDFRQLTCCLNVLHWSTSMKERVLSWILKCCHPLWTRNRRVLK